MLFIIVKIDLFFVNFDDVDLIECLFILDGVFLGVILIFFVLVVGSFIVVFVCFIFKFFLIIGDVIVLFVSCLDVLMWYLIGFIVEDIMGCNIFLG